MNLVRIVFLVSLWFSGHAQVADSSRYHFVLSSTGIINRTNSVRTNVFNNNFQADVNGGKFSFNTAISWIYGKQNKMKSNDDYYFIMDLNYRIDSSRFVVWALGNYEKSYSLQLANRAQFGSGLSYDIFNRDNNRLNISDGILYETSDVLLPDSSKNHYQTFRNSFRLKYRFQLIDRISLTGVHFIQNSLSLRNDYIVKTNLSIALKVYKWVNFTTALTYNKVNRVKRENILFTLGLSIDKRF
jgi:hypothetical protein